MILIIGKGTVIGAGVGLIVVVLFLAAIWLRWEYAKRILRSPRAAVTETRASMDVAFWLQSFHDSRTMEPMSFAARIIGISTGICMFAGFIIENIARAFGYSM